MMLGCETHLKEEINSNDILSDEFFHLPPNRKDRAIGENRPAIHNDIISVEQSSPADCEIVWTKLISHKKGDITFGALYRQPTSPLRLLATLLRRSVCS